MASGIQDAIRAGDVLRPRWPDASAPGRVNLYLGSGRFGACFDAWGLMHAGRDGASGGNAGNTVLMHAEHWHRDEAGLEFRIPLARLVWADGEPARPTAYRQQQEIHDGRLTTELTWPGLKLTLVAQFHPEQRDVLGVEVRYETAGDASPMPALLLAPETRVVIDGARAPLAGSFTATGPTPDGMAWAATVKVGTAESIVALNVARHEGEAAISRTPAGARVEFTGPRGRHLLLIGAGAPSRGGTVADDLTQWKSPDAFADGAAAAWHKRWGDAHVQLPDAREQALWARSAAYLLWSYAADAHCPAPSHGWTGNGPGTHSPRDAAAVVPALLRLGHADIAKSVVDYYRSRLEAVRAFTRRVWPAAEGAAWPPDVPIGPNARRFADGVPGDFRYTLTAAECPAWLARETSRYLRDPNWTRDVAWPIVHDAARFFASLLKQRPDGKWAFGEVPFAATDDHSAISGVRYCLQTAIAMAGEVGAGGQEFANYRGILSDELAYPPASSSATSDDAPPNRAALARYDAAQRADGEGVQLFDMSGAGPTLRFSLGRHGWYARNVMDALLANDYPREWEGAVFANIRGADGKLHRGQ